METALAPAKTSADLAHAVESACSHLSRGDVVALPTETVYGLAADALRPMAVAKVFEAKERPFFDPLICHLPDVTWLDRMALVPAERRALVQQLTGRFWPGPLTLVLPRSEIVPDLVTSGLPSVALRMSAHPVFAEIVRTLGQPLAAPSANRFGRISPTCAADVLKELGGRIPLVVDGGPCAHGLESTIVALAGETLRILRSGPVTMDALEEFGPVELAGSADTPEAPGQMASHYAPATPLHFVTGSEGVETVCREAGIAPARAGCLAWRSVPNGPAFKATEVLSSKGDLAEAATSLFQKMRLLDEAGLDAIFAEAVPGTGLGIAINDRLRKAGGRSTT